MESVRTRWWPLPVILSLCALTLFIIWTRDVPARADRVVHTVPALAISALALLSWLLFFSRLSRSVRLASFAAVVALSLGCVGLLRITGVSGDLVPIIDWRWSEQDRSAGGGSQALTSDSSGKLPFRDFAQFLGPDRNAILTGLKLNPDWQAHPPREVWRQPVGEGWSAFAVQGGYAVTQEQQGPLEKVVCRDVRTGKVLWSHGDSTRYETALGGIGPRATPTLDGNRVFSMGATGRLNCLDLSTGRRLWTRDTLADGGRQARWGMSSSPLIIDNLVVVSAGGDNGHSLVAYDRLSGARVWSGGDDSAGYSSPSLAHLVGRNQILIFNNYAVAGHDPVDGSVLWRYPWPGGVSIQCVAQPVPLSADRVLVSSGYGIGSKLLQLVAHQGGDGIIPVPVWESPRLKAKFTNLVVRDRSVYGLDDGVLVCLDIDTGERRWKSGRYGHGQILLIDDLLLIQAESGEVFLVDADPAGHRERARLAALSSRTWNNPVLAAPYLLLRNDREAVCYELAVTELAHGPGWPETQTRVRTGARESTTQLAEMNRHPDTAYLSDRAL